MSSDVKKPVEQQDASPAPGAPAATRRLRRWLLLGVPAIAGLLGGWLYLSGGRYVETDNAYLKADKVAISSAVMAMPAGRRVRTDSCLPLG